MIISNYAHIIFSLLLIFSLSHLVVFSSPSFTQSLTGSDWYVENSNNSIQIDGTVPGNIYTDLLSANIISKPLYRYNNWFMRWVANDTWIYTKKFYVQSEILSAPKILLVCEGLDTISQIFVNDQLVLSTNNMHVSYSIDIRPYLVIDPNIPQLIRIIFQSPVQYVNQFAASYPYELPASDPTSNIPNRQFIRKAQSDFGWDWGTAFAAVGIWKPIYLAGFFEIALNDFTATHTFSKDRSEIYVNVTSYFQIDLVESSVPMQLNISLANQVISETFYVLHNSSKDSEDLYVHTTLFTIPSNSIQLWWPVGYGSPTLYPCTVTSALTGSSLTQTFIRQIGFRSIELIRQPVLNHTGLSFYFQVNSVPIFIKGANFIPVDVFHTRVIAENITDLLDSLLLANGNTVRVWGGGIYQQDALYDYADQHGLLVWQEFMFACATSPVTDSFLQSVKLEVRQQTRRLISHSSIVVFGGNNENEVALTWFPVTIANRDRYVVDYWKLYVDTIRSNFLAIAGSTATEHFVVSSPSNGPYSESPFTQIWGDANSQSYGDMHYYNYSSDCSNVAVLPTPRFISEFGFQSYPSLLTYAPALSEANGDYEFNSPLMLDRQHHPNGNPELIEQANRHFIFPNITASNSTEKVSLFQTQIYLTQVVQSICYSTALEYWRSLRNSPSQTMGILYWQLNDLWQAPTWSSIEYQGRWKQLHYNVKRSFAPVSITAYLLNDRIQVFAMNDLLQERTVNLQIQLHDWSRGAVLMNLMLPTITLYGLSSAQLYSIPLSEFLQTWNCAAPGSNSTTNTIHCYFTATLTDSDGDFISSKLLYWNSLKNVRLTNPHITLNYTTSQEKPYNNDTISLVVACQAPSPYTFLETIIPGIWTDNSFFCQPNQPFRLTFTPTQSSADLTNFLDTVQIYTIYQTQHFL